MTMSVVHTLNFEVGRPGLEGRPLLVGGDVTTGLCPTEGCVGCGGGVVVF